MTSFRRLEVPSAGSPYERASRCPLRALGLTREEFDRVLRDRPSLAVEESGALLLLQPVGEEHRLHFGFPDRDSFRRLFPALLGRALEAADRRSFPAGVYLYFGDHPNRPFVEPVLRGCAFEPVEEWVEMTLPEVPDLGAGVPKGFAVRPFREADLPQVIETNNEAFGAGISTLDGARRYTEEADAFLVAESKPGGRVAGFVRLLAWPPATGVVDDLAVRPSLQRRGLGEALMRRALRWCRETGLPRSQLLVRINNAPALALYRKLGFAPGATGLTYRRPIDEREARRFLQGRRGTYIKFGGWR